MRMSKCAGGWVYCLIPVIPASWEAETRKITVRGLLVRLVSTNKPGMVVVACNPSYVRGISREIMVQGCCWAKITKTLSKK
jgi:hypothetical protein